ncbi:hypothetical protein [Natrinema pallidum]|uniref:Uncharacterized protein n=1 Tax=Natrinema pallidum DSM 3751 TaxID=1227495 RepID=L9YI99_9EURY|nr:hypothetical protein [Natrinema pallidum]ELY73237.1 hypothetical protein C487_17585 [Natrinema pallidum DSM 3751]
MSAANSERLTDGTTVELSSVMRVTEGGEIQTKRSPEWVSITDTGHDRLHAELAAEVGASIDDRDTLATVIDAEYDGLVKFDATVSETSVDVTVTGGKEGRYVGYCPSCGEVESEGGFTTDEHGAPRCNGHECLRTLEKVVEV